MRTWISRVVVLLLTCLLVASVIVGFSVLRDRLAKPQTPAASAQTDGTELSGGAQMGPFSLYSVYSKIGAQNYVSFSVYYRHDGAEELWYACGRMFPASQVEEIVWADAQYNIEVRLKNGKSELFSYDGNNNWQ